MSIATMNLDRTEEFIACTLSLRTSQHASLQNSTNNTGQAKIKFLTQVAQIMRILRDKNIEISRHKRAYMNMSEFSSSSMSDNERDEFETQMLDFASKFGNTLKKIVDNRESNVDGLYNLTTEQHFKAIGFVLVEQVKNFVGRIKDMQSARMRLAKQRLASKMSVTNLDSNQLLENDALKKARQAALEAEAKQETINNTPQLSQEQIVMLESENKRIHNQFSAEMQALTQAESRLTEIAQQFDQFMGLLAGQEEAWGRIETNYVSTNSNMELGHMQLIRSLQYSAHFRLNVLFVFVLAGLSLLFLDWFSD